MFTVLDALRDRLFLPKQVAVEFFRNRDDEIASQVRAFQSFRRMLEDLPSQVNKNCSRHPVLPIENIQAELRDLITKQLETINNARTSSINYLETGDDPILSKLSDLFPDEQCGHENPDHEREIARRFDENLPPCYWPPNKTKPVENTHYGDGKLWLQVLDHAQSSRRHILFVTSDTRQGNWWRSVRFGNDAKEIGPHYCLINDVQSLHSMNLVMYTLSDFLKLAESNLKVPVDRQAIDEIKQVEDDRAPISATKTTRSNIHNFLRDLRELIIHFDVALDFQKEGKPKAANDYLSRDEVTYVRDRLYVLLERLPQRIRLKVEGAMNLLIMIGIQGIPNFDLSSTREIIQLLQEVHAVARSMLLGSRVKQPPTQAL